jgi:hypothetical protein
MELNYAELYGIDIKKLREESFLHPGHWRMLREHRKRVEAWYGAEDSSLRHTGANVSGRLADGKIITNEKNGQ